MIGKLGQFEKKSAFATFGKTKVEDQKENN
jgi:hypothetical protein